MRKVFFASLFLYALSFGPNCLAQDVDSNQLYGTICALCHGAEGKPTLQGQKFGSPDFSDSNWQTSKTDDQLVQSMTKGTDNPNYAPVSKLIADMLGINVDVNVFVPKVRSFVPK